MTYKHLSLEERYFIKMNLSKKSVNAIAKELNRSQSTVQREVLRNKSKKGYKYKQAHKIAQKRHNDKTCW